MRTLDRYIVRNFLTSAALWFLILMALRIVVDLFVNMDEYVKNAESAAGVFRHVMTYYGYHSLEYFAQLGGVIVVAAATFTLALMGKTNELTAMLASGVSLHRVVWPIVLCSILMGGLIVIDQELVIPISAISRKLALPRDDIRGVGEYKMPFVADGAGSVWRANAFYPAEAKLANPVVFLRDSERRQVAGIFGKEAHPGELAGLGGWMITDAVLLRTRQKDRVWPSVPDTSAIQTVIGPAELEIAARSADPSSRAVKARDLQYPMVLEAARLLPSSAGQPAVLEKPTFSFFTDDGRLLGAFVAESATWREPGRGAQTQPDSPVNAGTWQLHKARLFCPSDLTRADLVLRRNSRWLDYMSSAQITQLLEMGRVPNTHAALLVKHTRLTDPLNNLIMLLLALPFILSRERRDVKASASLCLLMVGVFYAFIHLCRYVGLEPALGTWAPAMEAWLPAMIFGPIAVVMLDSLKT